MWHLLLAFFALVSLSAAQAPAPLTTASLSVGGVFPQLTLSTESGERRSESGHGAMMAWADRLWVSSDCAGDGGRWDEVGLQIPTPGPPTHTGR